MKNIYIKQTTNISQNLRLIETFLQNYILALHETC